mgnify:FL=1
MLDMDGTLLDLHFDNHFWREHVPRCYAEQHGLEIQDARDQLFPKYRALEGTMDWYCVDYWSRELDLDIAALKTDLAHLISIHPGVTAFLDCIRRAGKRAILVTNAHAMSLNLKMEQTGLAGHFDTLVCAHDLGYPKEDLRFWRRLARRVPFDPAATLFVDDSLPILRTARHYGIRHLLAVRHPESKGPPRDTGEFKAIESFAELGPGC